MNISNLLGNYKIKIVLIILGIIVVLYVLYKLAEYLMSLEEKEPFLIKGEWDGYTENDKISGKKLLMSDIGHKQSFQFWIYIEDYTYKFSKPKHIFHVGSEDGKIASPSVWLFPKTSDLSIRFDSYNDLSDVTETISGIPCQKWNESSPHDTSEFTDALFPDADLGDHNYCRNPRSFFA